MLLRSILMREIILCRSSLEVNVSSSLMRSLFNSDSKSFRLGFFLKTGEILFCSCIIGQMYGIYLVGKTVSGVFLPRLAGRGWQLIFPHEHVEYFFSSVFLNMMV